MNRPPKKPVGLVASESEDRADLRDLLEGTALGIESIAKHLDPEPPELVNTKYVAEKLGCSVPWVSVMAAEQKIPKGCIIAGTGNGKQWRFHREKIDRWIAER